jgi:hypothetical protein
MLKQIFSDQEPNRQKTYNQILTIMKTTQSLQSIINDNILIILNAQRNSGGKFILSFLEI